MNVENKDRVESAEVCRLGYCLVFHGKYMAVYPYQPDCTYPT